MKPGSDRWIRVAIARVSYDIVLTATNDTGVAKLAGTGELLDPATGEAAGDLGEVDLTFWGSTTAQLKMRARSWPARFDRVTGDFFGVSSAGEHRFDIFLSAERYFRLLDLAHGSRRAIVRLRRKERHRSHGAPAAEKRLSWLAVAHGWAMLGRGAAPHEAGRHTQPAHITIHAERTSLLTLQQAH